MAGSKISITDVRAKYPQYADVGDDQLLRALHQKHYSDLPEQEFMGMIDRPPGRSPDPPPGLAGVAPPAAPTRGAWQWLGDQASAIASGANRLPLFFAGVPGSTLNNLANIGKAAVGFGYGELTGKPPPEFLDPVDNLEMPGTSEWLLDKARSTSAGKSVLEPRNPVDEGGYAQNLGYAILGPRNLPQLVQAAVAATASKAAHDATGSPVAGLVAGFTPALAGQGLAAGVKQAVRGGEEGRLAMNQRVADLRAAGVDSPTVGLATGNRFLGGVENILADTPGAIGVMGRSRDNALRGLEATTQRAADLASTQRGPLVTGQGIQRGVRDFAADFRQRQDQLYDTLEQKMGSRTMIPVPNTRDALHSLTGLTPGAEAVTARLVNQRIKSLRQDFDIDTGLAVPQGAVTRLVGTQEPTRLVRNGEGLPVEIPGRNAASARTIQIPGRASPGEGIARPPDPMLPFGGVKSIRSNVGEQLSNELLSGVPNAQNKRLYGSLSEDMQNGAVNAGPGAERAFNRASDYTRAGMDRLERVAPFAGKDVPEDAYKSLVGTLTGGRSSAFDAVKKSLPQDVRGQVAGTVIENLGKAPNSKQGAAGDVWSPETFLTRWNGLTPEGQNKLLSGFPNAGEVRASIEAVAKSTAMMRNNNLFNNVSGTGGNTSARDFVRKVSTPAAVLAAGGSGLVAAGGGGLVSPWVPAAAVAGLATTNGLARGLTSQGSVNFLRSRTEMAPETQQNLLRTLYLTNAVDTGQK